MSGRTAREVKVRVERAKKTKTYSLDGADCPELEVVSLQRS
jgi:hypothetical protein